MPATLRLDRLGAAYGARTLFSDLSMTIGESDVWGLVGANGAGKSTLLRTLAGAPTAAETTGTVVRSPGDAVVGYLAQETERRPGERVRDFVLRRTGVVAAEAAMDAAADHLAQRPEDRAVGDRYAQALEHWLRLGGADVLDRMPEVAADLGLEVDLMALMTALSGGEAARAGLLALLLSRFDVLLLDEPTNDLDLAGLDRLERFVLQASTPMVVTSHDREFLARCVTGIVELDLAQRRVAVFDGGYDAYLAERDRSRRRAREAYQQYAEQRDQLRSRMQSQREWTEKGVRSAGRRPDGDKHLKARAVARTEKQAAKISQSERALQRLAEVPEPRREWDLRLTIAAAPRSGEVVAVLDGAVLTRGAFVLGPVTCQLSFGDRVVLTGANGSGKSSLIELLLERVAPQAGRAVLGAGVRVGEMDQARGMFTGPTALREVFAAQVPRWAEAEVRTLLAKFGLGGEHVHRACGSLSPGERTRAALALLQARGVNFLVLDEPTNHLDLPAIEQLEQAVDAFTGTLLLVSHDRRLLTSVRATRRWEMAAGRLTELTT